MSKSKYRQAAEAMATLPPGELVNADWVADKIGHPRTNVVQILGYLRQKGEVMIINPTGHSGGNRLYRLDRTPALNHALSCKPWTKLGFRV